MPVYHLISIMYSVIVCKSAKTMHIHIICTYSIFGWPRWHPICLPNEIRLTPMCVSLRTGVQGRVAYAFGGLCICALHVWVSLEISHFSRRHMGRLWNYRIIVAAYCSYSQGSLGRTASLNKRGIFREPSEIEAWPQTTDSNDNWFTNWCLRTWEHSINVNLFYLLIFIMDNNKSNINNISAWN